MKRFYALFLLLWMIPQLSQAQADTTQIDQTEQAAIVADSTNAEMLAQYKEQLESIEKQRLSDSVNRAKLEEQLASLKTTDNLKKEEILQKLQSIEQRERDRYAVRKARVDSLRATAVGYPVIGPLNDTIFVLYARLGSYSAKDRANVITSRIERIYKNDALRKDSLKAEETDQYYDITCGEDILMTVTNTDAIWSNSETKALADEYSMLIDQSIRNATIENSLPRMLTRIGLVLLTLLIGAILIKLISFAFRRLEAFIAQKKETWLKDLSYKDYTFLSAEQELRIINLFINALRWLAILILLYLLIPITLSIFPFTRGWSDDLFGLLFRPFSKLGKAVWDYLPNVFTILVILFVMRYLLRFVKYIFGEIESGKLKIGGFHRDWAMPTYSIVRFLFYAFTFIMIFPYLPGSDSDIFKGVSVFIGILFSLGSSSAIANMVAGLVITYMRPFKQGDRIRIGDISGDVVEKNLLVTRLRTIKNEEITIPNSTVLAVNTINYNSYANKSGLILTADISIGYDVPWPDVYAALIEAANRSKFVLKSPAPFVTQSKLQDFYIEYKLSVYTHEANRQSGVLTSLFENILDVFNERGIEIMSPHYYAKRDGSEITIPAKYNQASSKETASETSNNNETIQP